MSANLYGKSMIEDWGTNEAGLVTTNHKSILETIKYLDGFDDGHEIRI
jgi:hypothetical protein